jgi:uncharacterized membrane protein
MARARKHEISRLEAFSDAVFAFALWALLMPGRVSAFAGFVYFLMGPAHWAYGEWNGRRRQAFLKTRGAAAHR